MIKQSVNNLLNVVVQLLPGTSKKGTIEQYAHLIFTSNEIITFNAEMAVSVECQTNLDCTVNAESLISILKKIDDEFIEIEQEADHLKFKTESLECSLPTLPKSKKIIESLASLKFNEINVDDWQLIPENLIEGLKLCLFSTSKDFTQWTLNNVQITDEWLFATDNVRISKFALAPHDAQFANFLLPSPAILELIKFDTEPTKTFFVIRDSWVHFQLSNMTIFSSRIVNAKFPDCLPLFDRYTAGTEIEFPTTLAGSIDLLSLFAEGDFDINRRMTITIENSRLICASERSIGKIKKTIKMDIPKEIKLSFIINPIFLAEILNHASSVIIGEKTALFHSGGFHHVLLLSMPK